MTDTHQPDTDSPVPDLTQTIEAFQQALLSSIKQPNGQYVVNPLQLFLDSEMSIVRLDCLVDELAAEHCIDPESIVRRFQEKLRARTKALREPTARIQVANGHIPRGNG